jgi:hypothetical protein
MQTAWRTLREAVRRRIGRDRIEDAHDAARAEDERSPLGRPDQTDDPDSDPSGAAKDRDG